MRTSSFKRIMWIAVLFCFMRVAVAEDLQGPVNTAVVAGNPMSMVCGHNSSASPIKWNFKNPAMLGESPLFDGSNTFGGFVVHIFMNLFSREVILTKKKTQMEDAGIYKCIVDLPDQMVIRTAQLIVLASDPQCDTNTSDEDNGVLEGTFLRMWCSINVSGDFAPVMHWWRNDGKKFESTTTIRSGQMSYTITTELRAEDNNKIYSCSSYFLPLNSTDALQPGITRARNAPTYTHQWNFTAVVWFRPKSLFVEPIKESYNYGNRLRCWGDGDATLAYKWVSLNTGIVIPGPDLIIDDTMSEHVLHEFECIAVHERSHTSISKIVNITITNESDYGFNKKTLLVILLPIGGVVVALNLGLILQKCYIRRSALNMARQTKHTASDYDEVDEAVVKSMTTEITTVEPTSIGATQETTIAIEDVNPHVATVSQIHGTRPYSSLSVVRRLPDIPTYSTLETTGSSVQGIGRSRESLTIEVHYVNVPMREIPNEDPIYMDLADKY